MRATDEPLAQQAGGRCYLISSLERDLCELRDKVDASG